MQRWMCTILTASSVAIGPAFAFAQDKPADQGSGADSGILAGPKVEPQATQQPNRPMRPNAERADQRRQFDIPFQQWMGALRGLGLSEQQSGQIKPISQEFQAAQRKFQDEHGQEMRDLFRQAREARQNGEQPPKDFREKMQQLEEARPKPDGYQARIWAILNETQQKQMKAKLEALRQEMMERRGVRRDDRRDARPPSGSPGDSPQRPRARGGNNSGDAPPSSVQEQPGDNQGDGEMMMESPMPAQVDVDRPRGNGPFSGPTRLDELAQRRLNFLRAHQSPRRPGVAPNPQQRQFDFEDGQGDHIMNDDPDHKPPPSPGNSRN